MNQIEFLRPMWLWALIPLAIIILLLIIGYQKRTDEKAFCDPHLLPYLVSHASNQTILRRFWPLILLALGWLVSCIILAGPVWEKKKVPVYEPPTSNVIVLNLSSELFNQNKQSERLQRIKLKLRDMLKRSQSSENALIVFAQKAYTVIPLTRDTQTIISMLPSLSPDIMPTNGNRPISGLNQAKQLIKQAKASSNAQVILITDQASQKAINAVSQMRQSGIRISVLAMGNNLGSNLKQLAQSGDGIYVQIQPSNKDIQKLTDFQNSYFNDTTKTKDEKYKHKWADYGSWLILILLILAIWGFRRGGYSLMITAFLPLGFMTGISNQAQAGVLKDIWQTPYQNGQQLLQQNKPEKAAQTFDSTNWKAYALQKAKDYQASLNTLQNKPNKTANDFYNMGNNYVHLKKYQKALKAYQKALDKNPDHQKAKQNYKKVQSYLKSKNKQESNNGQTNKADQDQASSQKSDQQKNSRQEKQLKQRKKTKSQKKQQMADKNQANNSQSLSSKQNQQDSQKNNQLKKNQNNNQKRANQPQKKQDDDQKIQKRNQVQSSAKNTTKKQAKPDLYNNTNQKAEKTQSQSNNKGQSYQFKPNLSQEKQQRLQNWLRQIPDDPADLLKREFQHQYRRQYQHRRYYHH